MFTRFIVSVFLMIVGFFWSLPAKTSESLKDFKKTLSVFRFDVIDEPSTLNPAQIDAGTHGYIVGNLFLTLFKHVNGKPPQPYLAKKCNWKGELKLICGLDPRYRFSDGSKIIAQDVVYSFQQVLVPENKSKEAHQLFRVLNAKEIYGGSKKNDQLGVSATKKGEVEFLFSQPDSEFIDRLSHVAFSIVKNGSSRTSFAFDKSREALFSGPYVVSYWESGKRIVLEPNRYFLGYKKRPQVEALFISDEQTSYRLFEKGQLELLRKIPVALVPVSEKRPEFFRLPVLRFDYFGFSAKKFPLFSTAEGRKLLSGTLYYDESDNIFGYRAGRFGCAGLTEDFTSKEHCLKFKPISEETHSPSLKSTIETLKVNPPSFVYSSQGGEFNRITAEWLQAQWKKNVGFLLKIESRESRVFSEEVKTSPPPIFLRRVGLDRATCLAALENFESDSTTNYVTYEVPEFDKILSEMRKFNLTQRQKKTLCEKGLSLLIQRDSAIIPTGQYALTMLISKRAKNFRFNDLNQLDLSNLTME